MKKILLYGSMMLSLALTAQQQHRICGFDEELALQERQNPGMREQFEKIYKKIRAEQLKNPSATTSKLVNGVYEIPVVVHVIYPNGAAVGTTYNKSDAQIQTWIENANKMYAGTYAWPASGVASDFGQSAVFPIKLVLAKRTPNCEPTTGIVRYNGNSLPGYNTNGMAYATSNGASRTAIKNLAPHWPESAYFNIYVISKFDGDSSPNSGLMGFASFPNNLDSNYESFMKSGVVTNLHDTTFAHEFGHAMGLLHTFQDGTYDAIPGDSDYCPPTTGVCEDDDDGICDTERSGSGYTLWPVPSNSDINPCTGVNYQGVQYNMMNYSNSTAQKFTAGQGERIDNYFMLIRSSLTTSKGATALPSTPATSMVPIAATCNPTGVTNAATNGFLTGPVAVRLGQINNKSAGLWGAAPSFYVDYTTQSCLVNSSTDLVVGQPQTVEVDIMLNPQSARVWIDYNNNGTFEASELVGSANNIALNSSSIGTLSATFTPPANAVLNTPLRMRVLVDAESQNNYAPCGQLEYGQVEDYSVRLVNNLATSEAQADNDDLVIYPNPAVSGDQVFIKAKNGKGLKVSISDMSGRLIANPAVTEEGKDLYKINQQLEKGVYMIQISNGKNTKASKLIIK